jgi:hypothetical protein
VTPSWHSSSSTAGLLAPFAMYAPFARSDYYEASAPPTTPWLATNLPAAGPAARRIGRPRMVPTFTTRSITEGGAHLYPDSIATTTPQTFIMASSPDFQPGFGVDHPYNPVATRCVPARIHQV